MAERLLLTLLGQGRSQAAQAGASSWACCIFAWRYHMLSHSCPQLLPLHAHPPDAAAPEIRLHPCPASSCTRRAAPGFLSTLTCLLQRLRSSSPTPAPMTRSGLTSGARGLCCTPCSSADTPLRRAAAGRQPGCMCWKLGSVLCYALSMSGCSPSSMLSLCCTD